MTRIGGRHPRRKDWDRYMCDECKETFFGPRVPVNSLTDKAADLHYCDSCAREEDSVHFTSGRTDATAHHDITYHGGQFTQGEW